MAAMHRRATRVALPVAVCLLGIALVFHPTLLSGFQRMHWDTSDTRHSLWTFEHAYLWLSGAPGHDKLWNPPVFYPAPGTFAYSENSLGLLPFYLPFRLAGFEPDTALQIFTLAAAALNFAAAFLLFSRALRLHVVPASLGAFLFAFANMRTSQLGHLFLMPQFFLVGAAWALVRLVAGASDSDRRRSLPWVLTFLACMAAQLWANLYQAWLFGFFLLVLLVVAACRRDTRQGIALWVRSCWRGLVLGGLLAALAVLPLLLHYGATVRAVGQRDFAVVKPFLVEPQAWINMGPHNWLYGSLAPLQRLRDVINEGEKRLGLGHAATVLAVAGVWFSRHRLAVRVVAIAVVAAALLVTRVGDCSLWCLVHRFVPGAGGFRAVSRLGLELLLPVSAFVALAFEELRTKRAWAVSLLAGLLLVAEQAQSAPTFDKLAARQRAVRVAEMIAPQCEVFYYAPLTRPEHWSNYHLDAMWAGMLNGKPTVNGYSSAEPVDYLPLRLDGPGGEGEEARLAGALAVWERRHGLDPGTVCWIK